MILIRILITTIFIMLACLITQAQTILYPSKFKCVSVYGPLMSYWADFNTNAIFIKDLDAVLKSKRNWALPNNTAIQFTPFTPINKVNPSEQITDYPKLNFNLIEYSTFGYIKQFNLDILDSTFVRTVLSVLRIEAQIEDKNQSIFFDKALDIFVKKGPSNGIGIPIQNLQFTKKGFLETLKKSLAILFDSTTTNEAIELTVAGAFVGDNFIFSTTAGLPRIQVSTTKGISKFKYEGNEQLIRWGEQLYNDVVLKGKNKTLLSEKLNTAFESSINKEVTKPIFLIQEGRDIVANKNYLLQLAAHIGADPNSYFARPKVEMIAGNHQVLFNEKDTVAVFEVLTNQVDSLKKLLLHQVSNGVDSSSIALIEPLKNEINLNYDFHIKGKLKEVPFEIKIAGDQYLREFYFNNELICIANGNKAPERFVMLDNSISSEIMNALFIIGFNSFFQ